MGLLHCGTGWEDRAAFEPDTCGLRKAVGVCRRVLEERRHWTDWTDWTEEDIDWGKRASVAELNVTAGNDLHYWSGRRRLSVGHSCYSFLGIPSH